MKINDYSFKYACAVCCLKILFYCLTFSAMSNINSGDFTTPNSQSLIFEIVMLLKFQNKTNIEMMGLNQSILDSPQNCQMQICEIQIFQMHIQICQIHIYPVSILLVSIMSSRPLQDMSSRRPKGMSLEDALKTCLNVMSCS